MILFNYPYLAGYETQYITDFKHKCTEEYYANIMEPFRLNDSVEVFESPLSSGFIVSIKDQVRTPEETVKIVFNLLIYLTGFLLNGGANGIFET